MSERAAASGAPAGTRPSPRRALAIDLLRLIAIFQMVQGHTMDAVLAEELRSGLFFEFWSWIRGLTSVAFLFAAGLSFHLATLLRLEAHRRSPAARGRRWRRASLLILLGYLLHLPIDAREAAPAFAAFLVVDVLQCIGVLLLVLEVLALNAPSARVVVGLAAALGAALLLVSDWTEPMATPGQGGLLLNYLSHGAGSIFPIAPWGAHLMLGVALGALAFPQGGATRSRHTLLTLGAAGAALLLLGLLLPDLLGSLACARLVPLGVVVLLTAGLVPLGARMGSLPAWISKLAAQSLSIYVFHILVAYGGVIGLSSLVGPSLSLGPALALTLALLLLSAGVGLGWDRLGGLAGLRRRLA
ncbi:MAG: DUF1624 domain-containing protein [Myxococcales bacterium]|nr:DUF1624 domain-containing protein [Myxococcales bacterium]